MDNQTRNLFMIIILLVVIVGVGFYFYSTSVSTVDGRVVVNRIEVIADDESQVREDYYYTYTITISEPTIISYQDQM